MSILVRFLSSSPNDSVLIVQVCDVPPNLYPDMRGGVKYGVNPNERSVNDNYLYSLYMETSSTYGFDDPQGLGVGSERHSEVQYAKPCKCLVTQGLPLLGP